MALPGDAGWVATHYDCCYYRRMQERNPFGQKFEASVWFKAGIS